MHAFAAGHELWRLELRRSLSETLWRIDWDALLPLDVGGGVVATRSSFEQAAPFVRDQYPTIFEETEADVFSTSRVSDAKARYYEITGDFVQFSQAGRAVGLFVGMPIDWSSYYIRSAAMLPEFQGTHAPQSFFRRLFPVLAEAGVERVELDVSPSNAAMMHIVTRLRFNATGTTLSERWGALIHFTKFIDRQSEDVFLSQFCSGVKYQRRERTVVDAEAQTRKGERS